MDKISILKKYKKELFLYFLLTVFILPLEAIGWSSYSSKLIMIFNKPNKSNKNLNDIYKYIIYILIIWLIARTLYQIKYRMMIRNESNFTSDFKEYIYKSIMKKYTQKYEEINIGKAITKMEILPELFQGIFEILASVIIPYSITIVILTLYYFFIDIKLGLLISLWLSVLIILLILSYSKIDKLKKEEYKVNEELNEKVNDRLTTFIQSIVDDSQDSELKTFKDIESLHNKLHKKYLLYTWDISTLLHIVSFIFISIILCYYTKLLLNTKDPKKSKRLIGLFLVIFYLSGYITKLIYQILRLFTNLSILSKYQDEIKHDESNIKKQYINKKTIEGLIELKNVKYKYKNHKAIGPFTFKFKNKCINCIVGKSGSGKSTLLKMILGIYDTYSGKIEIDGIDIKKINPKLLRKNIGFVNQTNTLNKGTIIDNIYSTYNGNKSNKAKKIEVNNIINYYGLNNYFKNISLDKDVSIKGSSLSGGQRQIINILRVLIQDKKIILFDEPTSSLDSNTKEIILKILKNVSKIKTIILVSHDKSIINRCDNLYTLNI